jgi:ribosomal protein S18 acetylase RimI-like enzyme
MIRIRPMRAADAARVAELTTQLGYPVATDELALRFADVGIRDDHELLVAVDPSDSSIGWIHVALHPTLEVSGTAVINGLVVDESARSGGIGRELVDAAEAWARARGATSIVVRTRSTRERAHRFYRRIGFVEIKRSHIFSKPLV